MERKILVAVDGSDCSRYAFNYYCDQINKENDFVHVVYSGDIRVSILKDADAVVESFRLEHERIDQMKSDFAGILRTKGIKGKAEMLHGEYGPGEAIVKHAKEVNAEMIVMGSRGLSKMKRIFVGSVSDYVVHHSDCPVIIIKLPQEAMDVDQQVQQK